MSIPRRAYSVAEVADSLGVSDRHIRNLIQRGKIRTVSVGRRRLITPEALETFMFESSNGG